MALTDTVFSCIPALMLDSKLLRESGTGGAAADAWCLPGGGGGGTWPPIGGGGGGGGAPARMNKVTSIY